MNNYIKRIIFIGEFISTTIFFYHLINTIGAMNIFNWLSTNLVYTFWILFTITSTIVLSFDFYKDYKRKKNKEFLHLKYLKLITTENNLFKIDEKIYRNNFTKEELEILGFNPESLSFIYPIPEELKCKHEKEIKEYWDRENIRNNIKN